jgi:hypothetical protein
MPALTEDLSGFARAIVLGREAPPQVDANYADYPADVAIEVYRNNYRGNLHDALAGAYPVVAQLVGDAFFRQVTRQYIGLHPSRSGNLHRYGAEMAGFIAGFAPARELPYLADVAALEWACHCAYFADDAATPDLGKLAQVPPGRYPELVLQLHPAVRLLHSRYPVAAIWHAHQPGAPEDFHIDLDSGPCNVLVVRLDDTVAVIELADADFAWLQAIHAGSPLGEATDAALARHPDFGLQAALQLLVAQQALSGFSLEEKP